MFLQLFDLVTHLYPGDSEGTMLSKTEKGLTLLLSPRREFWEPVEVLRKQAEFGQWALLCSRTVNFLSLPFPYLYQGAFLNTQCFSCMFFIDLIISLFIETSRVFPVHVFPGARLIVLCHISQNLEGPSALSSLRILLKYEPDSRIKFRSQGLGAAWRAGFILGSSSLSFLCVQLALNFSRIFSRHDHAFLYPQYLEGTDRWVYVSSIPVRNNSETPSKKSGIL